MAVLLGTRAARYVRMLLNNGIAAEMTKLNAEFGKVTPVPTFYAQKFGNRVYEEVIGEVYPENDITFPLVPSECHHWKTTEARVTSEVPIVVRVTHTNRDMSDLEGMELRSEIYGTAVFRTLRGQVLPELNPAVDTGIRHIFPRYLRTLGEDQVTGDEKRTRIDRVLLGLTVGLQEMNTDEGTTNLAALLWP